MKVLKFAYCTITILFIVWFLMSWLDIGFHNHVPDPVYHPYNLLILMKGWGA